MDQIDHDVTCLKIETYIPGKNAETFSMIRFGVFIESPNCFFKSPKPSGNPVGIVRSLRLDRAVVAAESSGRWSPIVRSLRITTIRNVCKVLRF